MATASFEISEYVEPAAAERRSGSRSLFRERIENMPVGKAVVVTGMARNNAASRAAMIGSQMVPKRKYSTHAMSDGRLQITRVS